MNDYYSHQEQFQYKEPQYKKKMTAYERRKFNSKKIAEVQFTPETKPLYEKYLDKKSIEYTKHINKKKDTWTVLDQRKEDELWDE
jgi:hypothetical protein